MMLSFLDVFFWIIILVIGVIACAKGFLKEIFGKGAIVAGLWIAFLTYKLLSPYILKFVKYEFLAIALAYLLIFLVVYLLVMVIKTFVSSAFEGEIFKGLDKVLGFIFGMIEGLALVALILVLLCAQPWFDVSSIFEKSFFYKILKGLIAVPVKNLSDVMVSKILLDGVLSNV